jgi:hypothetical protein
MDQAPENKEIEAAAGRILLCFARQHNWIAS